MAGAKLTGKQLSALLTLMAVDREISNPELNDLYRFTIDGADRRRLNDLKLVESRKVGRPFVHTLTDDGWGRCAEELGAPLPAGALTIAPGAVYALLGGLAQFLSRSGMILADVFHDGGTRDGGTRDGGTADSGTPAAAEPARAKPAASAELTDRIRAGYHDLAERPGAWVRLTALRPLLADATRTDVDAALLELSRDPASGVTIAPNEDQKALTSADRRDAVRIGGQDKHLLAIGN